MTNTRKILIVDDDAELRDAMVEQLASLRDLKGKSVAAPERSSRQAFVAGLATFVGLNPLKDITSINHEPGKSMQLFAEGKIDAFMGFAPEPQEMRARKIGR